MAYNFIETFNVVIPDFDEKLISFQESEFKATHGLIVEVAAIHAGTTANFNHYSADALTEGVNTWTTPYPKPILLNHDPYSEPIGRVMGARMETEEDGTPYTRLQVAILDPEAVKKVADGRYLTGSVGGKAEEAVCNICDTDWAKPKEGMIPCKHQRGKVYGGKVAVLNIGRVGFKEYSFVNMPADGQSGVRNQASMEASEDVTETWVKSARFFVLDMAEESVYEYTESEDRNVLDGMRKKDSLPLYMGLKGAFLSAQAIHEAEKEELSSKLSESNENIDTNNPNESDSVEESNTNMSNTTTTDEDILAVAEELSADLAGTSNADAETEESTETPEGEAAEDSDLENQEDEETPADAEESVPEGQERGQSSDVDPDDSTGAPRNREGEDVETQDEDAAEAEEDAELSAEENEVTEPHANALEDRVAELESQNARLRQALHYNLVERVIDMKIGLGLIPLEERAQGLEDHKSRTAASLADSLRDLANLEPKVSNSSAMEDLEIHQESQVVGNEQNVTTIDDTDQVEQEADPMRQAEDIFFETLMGRKSL